MSRKTSENLLATFFRSENDRGTDANDAIKFASLIRDSASGLDYALNRFYSSISARFTEPDPYSPNGSSSDPIGWNRYSYVGGDPINRIDPNGTWWCDPWDVDCYTLQPCGFGYETFCSPGPPPIAPPIVLPPPPLDAHAICILSETIYIYQYMLNHSNGRTIFNIADALLIVTEAELANLDDRFIVALAGAETTFGATANEVLQAQHSQSWGFYNSFDNIFHCAQLGTNAYCSIVNPYASSIAAISDVVTTIAYGFPYAGLSSVGAIFDTYSGHGNPSNLNIFSSQLGVDPSNVRRTRCK